MREVIIEIKLVAIFRVEFLTYLIPFISGRLARMSITFSTSSSNPKANIVHFCTTNTSSCKEQHLSKLIYTNMKEQNVQFHIWLLPGNLTWTLKSLWIFKFSNYWIDNIFHFKDPLRIMGFDSVASISDRY
jgi:hypothetical protein